MTQKYKSRHKGSEIDNAVDKVGSLAMVATTGSYNDLKDKPNIPEGGGSNITIDTTLSTTSTNPVQNKVITTELNKKGTYSKPSDGIPKSDLASDVQESLGKADTALQSFEEQYTGTVTSVKINGSTKNPNADGLVDLGNIVGGEGGSVIVPTKLSELENDNMTFVGRDDLIRDNVDANNITAPGAYLVQTGNGTGSVNFPEPFGIMSVFHAVPDQPNRYLCQIFVSQTKLYWRWKLDVWEEWRETLPILNGIVRSRLVVDGELVANGLRSQDWNPSDIDTLKFPFGLEVQAIASNPSSIPVAVANIGSILETLKWDLNAANQIYYATGINEVFFRSRWGGVWRPWRQFAFLDSNGVTPSSGTYTINGSIKANDYLDAYGISLYETFATKTELGDINAVLDAINGEVI